MIDKSVCFRLKLLLWKNFMIRKHHCIATILEIGIPLAVFILLAYLRKYLSVLKSEYVSHPTYGLLLPREVIYYYFGNNSQIFYAPKTEFTTELISRVQGKLNVADKDVKGLNNELELLTHYQAVGKNKSIRAIVFKNMNKHLKYVIRPAEKDQLWYTDDLFGAVWGYKENSGSSMYYFATGLIALQMALDTCYIEMVSKKELPVYFTMQEFPYPPHYNDGGKSLIFSIGLPFVTLLGFLLLFPFIVQRVMDEKVTGIKELMKMMGLKSWMLWLGWLLHSLIVNAMSILLITIFMTVKVFGGDQPVLQFCSPSVFAVFLLLYCISLTTFAFFVSSFFNKPTLAIIVGISIWFVCGQFKESPKSKLSTKIILAIFSPNRLLGHGYDEISNYESRGIGSNWGNIFTSGNNSPKDITLGLAFVIFIFSSSLFMLITMYMEAVKPGPYGLAKPPHFPAIYIWNKISRSNKVEDEEASDYENTARIEKPPKLKTGIAVKNLCKRYGTQTVVNNFSIDIYEGQITALLGHNGAGKTTTMSIITGMIGATSGKVFINNQDTKYHMDKLRSSLGFCPQINLHFKDLNVYEHLIFFAMLKGSSHRRAQKEAKELLQKMNLTHKQHSPASALSGGMKRKLSLGMALIGNSKVLILDEPTSGLDPEARREIWDMLLNSRGSRTVIITTHYMEEADVLGDRIAIMDHGKLMCYGTSMYLKKEYGAGYNLTLVRDEEGYKAEKPQGPDQVEALTKIVQGRIRSASLLSASGNRVIFVLPHDMKPYFGDVLGAVESSKDELFITNIALSVTTLEEVFLKVDSAVVAEATKDTIKGNPMGDDNVSFVRNPTRKQRGQNLIMMQICCLFKKRILVLKRKWMIYVVAVLIAVAAAILTLYLGEDDPYSSSEGTFDYDLNNYGKTTVYYGMQGSDPFLEKTKGQYQQLISTHGSTGNQVRSVSDMIIFRGKKNIAFYKDFLVVAAEFNLTSGFKITNAMFSYRAYHGAPISLNLLTNSALKAIMGNDYAISTSLAPLPNLGEQPLINITALKSAFMWFLLFPLGFMFLTGSFLMFPHMERVSNVKQLQLMCGVRARIYWLVCYLVDIVLYVIAVGIIITGMLIYGLFGTNAYNGIKEIGVLLLILSAYGVSVIPYTYLFTYKKTASSAFVWYFSANLLFAIVFVPIAIATGFKYYLKYLIFLIPYVGLTYMLSRVAFQVAWNYNWDQYTPEHKEIVCQLQYNPCCEGEDTPKCIKHRAYVSGVTNYTNISIMLASSVLYFVILLLLESNFVQKLWERVLVLIFDYSIPQRKKAPAETEHDREDVLTEMKRIADILEEEKSQSGTAAEGISNEGELLLVHQLRKRFLLHQAVKGVSFAVKSGECFGLLGVNGAGKTTTFRILTGDLPLITGEARILTTIKERIYLSKQHRKYLQEVGYCPQFDALNEVLTGREMLRVFAELRGISDGAEEEINMWIQILGLEEYANKRCGIYSGGNKRKLNVAIALIGGLPVVMLDEPTSGVDPVSRRKLWNTLSAIQKQPIKPSIILTSHSMEECEALCNNLVIMKAGRLECYGTIPNIKKKYAQGFTIMLKLKTISKQERGGPRVNDQNQSVKIKSSNATQASSASKADPRPGRASENQDQSRRGYQIPADDPIEVENLMKDIEMKYEGYCTLKDKHTGLLHYHINDKNKKWSQMFADIEKLEQKHPIIEDYNISETTLEEVFLTIARED